MKLRQAKFFLGLVLMGFWACQSAEIPETPTEARKFKVVEPLLTDTSFYSEYVADIHSLKNVDIRSRLRAYIEQIHVEEGAVVKEGQLLFSLSRKAAQEEIKKYQAQYQSIEAEIKQNDVEIRSTQSLFDKNIVSKAELDVLLAKKDYHLARLAEAKSTIALAQLHLTYADIRSPFAGVINRIPNKAGTLLAEGDLLTTLSDNNQVLVYFQLAESEYLNLQQEKQAKDDFKEVELELANGKIYPYKGMIETAESEFDEQSGNIAFRARFANPGLVLKQGSNGKILIKRTVKNALLIPQRACFEIQDKIFVFVVDAKGKVSQRNITVALRLPHLYAVSVGLKPGEKIVFEGADALKDGMTIVPEQASFAEAQIDILP